MASGYPDNPDIDWYMNLSRERRVTPRCPFASVEGCPRYYSSLSLLKNAGFTGIPEDEDERLLSLWRKSKLWPRTAETDTSVSGGQRINAFSNFCPEILYDSHGVFASNLIEHYDEIDREFAYRQLMHDKVPGDHWRWKWSTLTPRHFTECALYSPLSHAFANPVRNHGTEDHSPVTYNIGTMNNSPLQHVTAGGHGVQMTDYSANDLRSIVNLYRDHVESLGLDAPTRRRADAQIATIEAQLTDEPDPGIVRAAGRSLKTIIEGAIGGALGTGLASPGVWAPLMSLFG